MKKLILILLCFNFTLTLAQSQYTLEKIENSNEPKIIANFIMANPSHPEITNLKQKLAQMEVERNYTFYRNSAERQQTIDILNHLLNSNEKSAEAYVSVKNLSQCAIVVNFEGKKNYKLNIEPNAIGRMLIDKGDYTISSDICGAQYKNQRAINKDWELTLSLSK